jgi:endothelin-converting enzyme/putative endopeptidase
MSNAMRKVVSFLLAAAISGSLAIAGTAAADNKPVLGSWGVETQFISKDIKPGDDFYRFVNEGWLKTATPPPGFPYSNALTDASLKTQAQLRELMANILASNPEAGSDEALIADFYKSYMDVAKRNALGLTPLKPKIAAIAALKTREEVAGMMGQAFMASFISAGVGIDAKNPKRYVVKLSQSGLGLPSPEYYLTAGDAYDGIRTAYLAHISGVFTRAGVPDADSKSKAIMDLETRIAVLSWTAAQRRDPVKGYNLMTRDALEAYAPGFSWGHYMDSAGFGGVKEVVLSTDASIQALAKLFGETDVETMKAYLTYHYIDSLAFFLSEDWETADFAFHSTLLQGIAEQDSRENRAMATIGAILAEPLGHAYAKAYFPEDYRAKMEDLVANIRAAFKARLEANVWMDETTRERALAKLAAISSYVGYPDKRRDFSSIRLDPADLFGNVMRLTEFENADAIKMLDEPRREWMWTINAHVINAGYAPLLNSITFPAAILQSPFFDPYADPAVNYGAIGAVIGHELGHGFDDQGSQYDSAGVLRNWWTDASRAEFDKRTAVLVSQYNEYSPIEGMHVNGALTLGENIGDLGGISIAYDAYQIHVAKEEGGKAPVIDGFTGDQRFFLAWAQLWREVAKPDRIRQQLLSDPHSPNEYRVYTVRNLDAWYKAFAVQPGDTMYLSPEKRVSIW